MSFSTTRHCRGFCCSIRSDAKRRACRHGQDILPKMKQAPTPNCQLEKDASPFARECLWRIEPTKPLRILDVPCGFGRHSAWLASIGHEIIAIDIDPERVAATKKAVAKVHSVRCIVADAEKPLPVRVSTFDLAIVVHYYEPTIFENVARALKPGGHLIFETFGAQGYNWRSLPEIGLTTKLLEPHFDCLSFQERKCGPKNANAVVHALATRSKGVAACK